MLGAAWNVIHPLVMVLVYTLIFAQVIGAKLGGHSDPYAYGVYLCAGMLPWVAMVEVIERSKGVFVDNAAFLKHAAFPRVCLPAVVFASAAINFVIPFALFLIVAAVLGALPDPASLLWFVPLLAVHAALAIGIGVWAGTLNVFFRDVGQVVSVVLQLWFWLTPIVYVADMLPAGARDVLAWNPLTGLSNAYQASALGTPLPPPAALAPVLLAAAVALIGGLATFRRCAPEIVDEL